jgi:hypothetical protein
MNIYVFTEVVREEEIEEHKRTEMRRTWMEADRERAMQMRTKWTGMVNRPEITKLARE